MKLLKSDAKNLNVILGRTIKWFAPAYKANKDYGGIAKITDIHLTETHPITAEIISGDNLNHAISDATTDGYVALSDSDRPISYEVIE
jgi:hypothetical protein